MKTFASIIGGVVLIISLVIYAFLSWGVVLVCFWNWFLIPIFPSVPSITIAQAIGLSFLFGAIVNKTSSSKKEETKSSEEKYTNLASAVLTPWFILLLGWIFKIIFI